MISLITANNNICTEPNKTFHMELSYRHSSVLPTLNIHYQILAFSEQILHYIPTSVCPKRHFCF